MMKNKKWFSVFSAVAVLCGAVWADNPGSGGGGPCAEGGSGAGNGCISFRFTTGPVANHSELSGEGKLSVVSEDPSPTHSTPQALGILFGDYGILNVTRTAETVPSEVKVVTAWGAILEFTSTSMPITTSGDDGGLTASHVGYPYNAASVDAHNYNLTFWEGGATETDYIDLDTGNGLEKIRFSADLNAEDYLEVVEYHTPQGRVEQAADFGVDFVYDADDIIRQVKAPTRFLDIVVISDYCYEVRYYEPDEISAAKNTDGLYDITSGAVPFETWIVENPDGASAYNRMNISRQVGSTVRSIEFEHIDADNMWRSTRDGGLTYEETTFLDVNEERFRSKAYLRAGQTPDYQEYRYQVEKPWGYAQIWKDVCTVDMSTKLRTSYTYYENESETGRYGRKKSVQHGDGSWEVFDYDEQGRKILKVVSYKDVTMTAVPEMYSRTYGGVQQTSWTGTAPSGTCMAKVIRYSYAPNETSDVLPARDERPRMITEEIEGITVSKTYFTYKTEADGTHVHITEMCVDPVAAYGASSSLRLVKNYYASSAGNLLNGRLKSVEYPDGTMDSYSYERGNLTMDYVDPENSAFTVDANGAAWRVTTTHGTVTSPGGIGFKTTQEVLVLDELGNEALEETYVYTPIEYARVQWTVRQFDVYGNAEETWYSDGTQESGFWGTGCCGMDSETDRAGIEYAYTYDGNKRLETKTKQGYGGTADIETSYTYDAKGRQLTETRAAGTLSLTCTTNYYMDGRIKDITDEASLYTQYTYDDVNRTITETLPGGGTVITDLYADGTTNSVTGTAVVHETYDYGINADGTQWQTKYVGSAGTSSPRYELTTSDLLGRVDSIVKPAYGGGLLTEQNFYNSEGLLWKTEHLESSSVKKRELFEYDALGQLYRVGLDYLDVTGGDGVLQTESLDRITEYSQGYHLDYDAWYFYENEKIYLDENDVDKVRVVKDVRKLLKGGKLLNDSPQYGLIVGETVVTNEKKQVFINCTYVDRSVKKKTLLLDGLGHSVNINIELLVNGLMVSESSSRGVTKDYDYDDLGRITEVCIDNVENGVSRSVAETYHYNSNGQIDWTEDGAGNKTHYTYYADSGMLESKKQWVAADNKYLTTWYEYDLYGRMVKQYGADYPVRYVYDGYGQLEQLKTWRDLTDEQGETDGTPDVTTWNYDLATGLLTSKLDAESKGPTYTYWPDGRMKTRTWERMAGVQPLVTFYGYTEFGQLETVDYSDSTPDVGYTYNRVGQKKTVTDVEGTRTFVYDNDTGLVDSETLDTGRVLFSKWDSFGRNTGYTLYGSGIQSQGIDYGYDPYGRFKSITANIAAARTDTFTYDWMTGADLLRGYSVPIDNGTLKVDYGYEQYRNLKDEVYNWIDNDPDADAMISKYEYVYDELGRRTQRTDTLESQAVLVNSFGYNDRSEVWWATRGSDSEVYDYDDIGNRTKSWKNSVETDYTPNSLNQYDAAGGVSYTYDDDGNLTSDGTKTYGWNAENRLVAVSEITPVQDSRKLLFAYDYMGRRISKEVYLYDATAEAYTLSYSVDFIYDGWNLVQEIITASETYWYSYVWGLDLSQTLQGAGGVGGLLVRYASSTSSSTPSPSFATCDANGNIVQYTLSNGMYMARYAYDSFGNVISESGPCTGAYRHKFSSKYYDWETGFYYYGYRYYDSVTGKWLSKDPLGEKGGYNLYGFCGNNSVNFSDPYGLSWGKVSLGSFLVGAIAGVAFGLGAPPLALGIAIGAVVVSGVSAFMEVATATDTPQADAAREAADAVNQGQRQDLEEIYEWMDEENDCD